MGRALGCTAEQKSRIQLHLFNTSDELRYCAAAAREPGPTTRHSVSIVSFASLRIRTERVLDKLGREKHVANIYVVSYVSDYDH